MRIGTSLLFLLIGAVVFGNVQIAFGNGRTTPQTRDALTLKAMCSQSAGEQLEIYRVRVISGDSSDETLTVAIEGVRQGLLLSEIKLLRFLATEISADGFIKASISRIDGAEVTSAMVQVRSDSNMIRLIGFRSNGTSVSIDLSKCQSIAFSHVSEGATKSKSRPVTAD